MGRGGKGTAPNWRTSANGGTSGSRKPAERRRKKRIKENRKGGGEQKNPRKATLPRERRGRRKGEAHFIHYTSSSFNPGRRKAGGQQRGSCVPKEPPCELLRCFTTKAAAPRYHTRALSSCLFPPLPKNFAGDRERSLAHTKLEAIKKKKTLRKTKSQKTKEQD